MKTAYIGIGSNLGDKRHNCLTAIEMIEQIPGCQLTGRSDWYLTKPVGVKGQEWYMNGVVSISIEIPPQALLRTLLEIEADMGRVRGKRWESRIPTDASEEIRSCALGPIELGSDSPFTRRDHG
jgi:2-amino-4-hydroxy-6-hydroxymethyldihydropteridine diphosphokinase